MAHKQHTGKRLINAVIIAVGLFVSAVVALVAYKMKLWPWEVVWFEGGEVNSLVLAIIEEQRYDVAVLAAVVLSGLLLRAVLVIRSAHPQTSLDELVVVADAVDDGVATSEEDKPGAEQAVVEPVKTAAEAARQNTAKHAGQLEIATAELTRLRRELASSRSQLDMATQAKTQFLANMSHELRTPMNGIMGMTELLLSSSLEAREKRFVTSIGASAEALLGIINDLLDFSKIETGSLYLDRSRFKMRDCVEDICSSLAQSAHVKGIELICYIDDDVPKQVDGDANRVRQVLKNLVSNAIAFTHEGEVVVRVTHVETRDKHHILKCDVQDSGVGIAPELQASLFNAFTQADSSTTRKHGGLGMGLAITQQLIKMMKGDITFRSRLGEGTRFTFTMQLDEARDADGKTAPRRDLRGSRVLVVDDNETNRTILYHQLNNWGVHVDTVEDGQSALSYLHRTREEGFPYDVLILDLHMPGMDGIELARTISADPLISGIRSLMLTSAVLDLDSTALAEIGIDKYISKPARQSLLHDSLVSLMPHVAETVPSEDEVKTPSVVKVSAHVLLAEDNVVNQDVACSMLELLGCTIETAADGRSAVELAAVQDFDVIFMDCQMPHMDGFEATRQIRRDGSKNARTPIVALTANALEGDRERCLEQGMDDYLSKPVRQEQISDQLIKWARHLVVIDGQSLPEEPQTGAEAQEVVSTPVAPEATTAKMSGDSDSDSDSDSESASAAASAAASSTTAVINDEAIDTIRALQKPGKADLLSRVVGMYIDKSPSMIEAMKSASDAGEFADVKLNAHSLRSSSAYLGADALAKACDDLEVAADAGDQEQVTRGVAEVESCYAEAAEALAGHVSKAA